MVRRLACASAAFATFLIHDVAATTYSVTYAGKALTPIDGSPSGPTSVFVKFTIPGLPKPGQCAQYSNAAYLKTFSDGVNTYRSLLKQGFAISAQVPPLFYICAGKPPHAAFTGEIYIDLYANVNAAETNTYSLEGITNSGNAVSSQVATCTDTPRGCISGALYESRIPVTAFHVSVGR